MLEEREALFRHICDLKPVATSHGVGEKRVIATQETVGKPITQIARTKLQAGEKVEEHAHLTMDEHFFFLSGECVVVLDGVDYVCKADDYLFVPAGCQHWIDVTKETVMITIGIESCSKNILA